MPPPPEEITYRQGMQMQLGRMDERQKTFEQDVRGDLKAIKIQTTATNGKIRKIIMVLILLSGIVIGQNFSNTHDILTLIAHAL